MALELSLAGQVALITGGTRGIGQAIALALGRQGVRLALNYLRNAKAAEATADLLEQATGHRPLLLKGNVGDPAKVAEMFATFGKHYQQLDILISNAASGVLRPPSELTAKHLQWSMEINAYALLYLAQHATPLMTHQNRGKIVAITSRGGTHAYPNYTAVGASKGALEAMIRHLSLVYAAVGININSVCAGVVDTEALSHFPNREALLETALAHTPAGRLTTPTDVADVVLFLCSDLSRMIHGQTIVVDGGTSVLAF